MRTRRFKAAWIDPQELVSVFLRPPLKGPTKDDATFLHRQIQFAGVPEDAEVMSVNYDYMRGVFAVIIYSESFPEVPDGELIPIISVVKREVIADQHGNIIATALINRGDPGDPCYQNGPSWRELPPLF